MNGSRVLEGFIPDVDATVVTRLLDAGATISGKTNAEDLCFSGASHTCALGPVPNPRKPTHAAGASSNGSAVVLVTEQVDMALGGDQGGLDPDPRRLERGRRAQADVRPRALHRLHDDRDDPRSLRPHGQHGGGCGPDAVGDRGPGPARPEAARSLSRGLRSRLLPGHRQGVSRACGSASSRKASASRPGKTSATAAARRWSTRRSGLRPRRLREAGCGGRGDLDPHGTSTGCTSSPPSSAKAPTSSW